MDRGALNAAGECQEVSAPDGPAPAPGWLAPGHGAVERAVGSSTHLVPRITLTSRHSLFSTPRSPCPPP